MPVANPATADDLLELATTLAREHKGEIVGIVAKLDPEVDVVVAGHTHALIAHYINGTPTVETYGLGKSFSVVDLWLDPKSHAVLPQKTQMAANLEICQTVDSKAGSCDPRKLSGRTDVDPVPATFHAAGARILRREAEARGCKVIDGLGMLVGQGRLGIQYWTGVMPDAGPMRAALERVFA